MPNEIRRKKRVQKPKTMWHPGFCAGLRLELADYYDRLEFIDELNLNKAPRRIDILVLVVPEDIRIEKNIAEVFRRKNIFEYKSPDDALTENDFYNGLSYAYQFKGIDENDVGIDNISLSFVCYDKPVGLFAHLAEHNDITNTHDGIYVLSGDRFPIQIIVSSELNSDNNLFLRSLRRGVDPKTLLNLIAIDRKLSDDIYNNYFEIVSMANIEKLMEVDEMTAVLETMSKKERVEFMKKMDAVAALFGWDKKVEAAREAVEFERQAKEAALKEAEQLRIKVKMLEDSLNK